MAAASLPILLALLLIPRPAASSAGSKGHPLKDDLKTIHAESARLYRDLEDLDQELVRLSAELRVCLKELRDLTAEYGGKRDLDVLLSRRETLYHDGFPVAKRLSELNTRFEVLLYQADHTAIVATLSSQGVSREAVGQFFEMRRWRERQREMENLAVEARGVALAETAARDDALKALSRRRALRWAACAAAVFLAALASLLVLWRAGRRAAPALPAPVGAGTVLAGKFRLLRELGRDGMGVLYEAEDLSLGRKVAVRRLHPSLPRAGKELQEILARVRLAAGLQHPDIGTVYEALVEGDRLYLLSELTDGAAKAAASPDFI